MKLKLINNPEKIDINLRQVEMDEPLVFLSKEDGGFKTFGVSSCIAFIAYYRDKLLSLYHWSTPSSDALSSQVKIEVDKVMDYLQWQHETRVYNPEDLVFYAVGGQESCQKVLDYLRKISKPGILPFGLNTKFLHIAPNEDYIDLYIPNIKGLFFAVYYKVDEECSSSLEDDASLVKSTCKRKVQQEENQEEYLRKKQRYF